MAVVKTIQDYYEQLFQKYPHIPKKDIKRICMFGWKQLYLLNSYGGDTLIKKLDFWCYIGSLTKNSLRYFNYYKRKMVVKLRTTYKRKKIPWDGYYYFALSENQYKKYLEQKNKRGKPKKYFIFKHVYLYKIYDECNIINSSRVAIFKVPFVIEGRFFKYMTELKTDKAELVLLRNPLTFKDVLLSNYNYQFISDFQRKSKKSKK